MNEITENKHSAEEDTRLAQPSPFACAICLAAMTVGEAEAGAVCTKCYFDSHVVE
jgi:hypothetical protein